MYSTGTAEKENVSLFFAFFGGLSLCNVHDNLVFLFFFAEIHVHVHVVYFEFEPNI
jgi:hypothetical protein